MVIPIKPSLSGRREARDTPQRQRGRTGGFLRLPSALHYLHRRQRGKFSFSDARGRSDVHGIREFEAIAAAPFFPPTSIVALAIPMAYSSPLIAEEVYPSRGRTLYAGAAPPLPLNLERREALCSDVS